MISSTLDAPKVDGKLGVATRVLNVISLGILAIGVTGLGFHNLGNRFFWTDESSTFYAGLGWPAPGAEPSPVSVAWETTMKGFLDPGIFHMLVRFWTLNVGADPVTLRLLPFLFFLVYVGAILGLTRLLGAPLFVGAGVAGLMLLENITPYYSVELRPYSAGLAAAVALPLVVLWLIKQPSLPRLLTLFAAVALFGSMQYNSMPVTWALAVVLMLAWRGSKNSSRNSYLFIASAFVFLWQPFLYVLSRGNPLQSTGGSSLDYIPDLVLTAMPTDRLIEVITANLLSPTALPRTIFVIVIPLFWWRNWLPRNLTDADWGARCLNYLWWIVVVATLSTVVLSVLGFIPWILGTRWSIAEVGFIALSTTGLAALVVRSNLWKNPRLLVFFGVVAVLAATLGATRLWLYERPNNVDVMSTFAPGILSGKLGGTVIDVWLYPTVRYSMEFSGDHNDLFAEWVNHRVMPSARFDEADAADIQLFLESDSDRLLLRSESALTESGIDLPDNIEVMSYQPDSNDGEITIDLPILLIKK